MHEIIKDLINLMNESKIIASDVISWGAPIPSFGDPYAATVATLGLNPSNKEFVDNSNQELQGQQRRFHTLESLDISSWDLISEKHIELIENSCTEYFQRNPYNGWFKSLDSIISGTSASYYNKLFHAVHLDLIPFATNKKWAHLESAHKNALLEESGSILGKIITKTPIRILILNGKTVVDNFEKIANTKLHPQYMPEWNLTRNGVASVRGVSYKGIVTTISDVTLKNPILVLGFNHNIQSSFGVTLLVRNSIRDWITKQSVEAL